MVSDHGWIFDSSSGAALLSPVSTESVRAILARIIERSRAEGAAAERERIAQEAAAATAKLERDMLLRQIEQTRKVIGLYEDTGHGSHDVRECAICDDVVDAMETVRRLERELAELDAAQSTKPAPNR